MLHELCFFLFFFFFNDTATTEIYTLSLHDALPIFNLLSNAVRHSPDGDTVAVQVEQGSSDVRFRVVDHGPGVPPELRARSEEHTSELQSRLHLVCRLLLEKKNNNVARITSTTPTTL